MNVRLVLGLSKIVMFNQVQLLRIITCLYCIDTITWFALCAAIKTAAPSGPFKMPTPATSVVSQTLHSAGNYEQMFIMSCYQCCFICISEVPYKTTSYIVSTSALFYILNDDLHGK